MILVLAPHNDDETLFTSFIIQRLHPLVAIVTDGDQHWEKFGIPPQRRRNESEEALKILGAEPHFMGLSDISISIPELTKRFEKFKKHVDIVFAPAIQDGNDQHDLIGFCANKVFGDKVIYYSTYSRPDITLRGDIPIVGTQEEILLKNRALKCYTSQIERNSEHFDAVKGSPEFINFRMTI